MWRDLMRRIAPELRCITLDAPGNGRTRSKNKAPVTLRRASAAIRGVIEALNLDDITLVLHDLCGPSGILAVEHQPPRVRGIVAMNTFAWEPDHRGLRIMLAIMGSGIMREFDAATGLIPRIASTAFGAARHLDRADREAFRAAMSAGAIRSFHQYMSDALYSKDVYRTDIIRGSRKIEAAHDFRREKRSVRIPGALGGSMSARTKPGNTEGKPFSDVRCAGVVCANHSGVAQRREMKTARKIIVVTGANAGIGFATASALSEQGAALAVVCRDAEPGRASLAAIGKVTS